MDRPQRDDPVVSAQAWARFRTIFRRWSLFTLAVVIAITVWLACDNGPASIHLYIATALGVGFTMLLGGALMGLVFLSSTTGHDEAVRDFEPDNPDED